MAQRDSEIDSCESQDGVLADFDRGVRERTGNQPKEQGAQCLKGLRVESLEVFEAPKDVAPPRTTSDQGVLRKGTENAETSFLILSFPRSCEVLSGF